MAFSTKYRDRGISIAVLLGIVAVIVEAFVLSPYAMPGGDFSLLNRILISTAIYLFWGGIFGLIWRVGGWKWGFWIAAPSFLLTLASILFTWIFTKFLTHDLPLLVITIVAPSLGSHIGARLRSQRDIT